MENLILQSTNEATQTTTYTTLKISFSVLAKKLMHTIYNLQREQPVHRFKAKTMISLCTNETTETTNFLIDRKNFLILKITYTTSFS